MIGLNLRKEENQFVAGFPVLLCGIKRSLRCGDQSNYPEIVGEAQPSEEGGIYFRIHSVPPVCSLILAEKPRLSRMLNNSNACEVLGSDLSCLTPSSSPPSLKGGGEI